MNSPSAATAPEPGLTLAFGCRTDRGLVRELNEDSLLAADPVFAVADGMGGHEAGEVASELCVKTLRDMLPLAAGVRSSTAIALQECILAADARIRNATGGRAGTTLSGVVVVEQFGVPYWLVMNIGDSRTYRLSQGLFTQISVDHSEVQELVETGRLTEEEAAVYPRRHVITRGLGTGDATEADFWLLPILDGDRILVCSDGLTGELDDEHLSRILGTVAGPQASADALIEAALRSGGRDNVTAIVVDARLTISDAKSTGTRSSHERRG
ncbi:PP2C family protein-serine/threonine phosphatase [Arthrobacter sp. MA-N2]|uniref:PP2C family protein-serine/threonine phosphatase n=1 Tax=Arthrobacter sp. MA-N2 TaxID=1101188 RepID=UPI0004B85943|nr:protein phosphatase 2C domain-containing protein [Arthrobacter sp. MA-N2]